MIIRSLNATSHRYCEGLVKKQIITYPIKFHTWNEIWSKILVPIFTLYSVSIKRESIVLTAVTRRGRGGWF